MGSERNAQGAGSTYQRCRKCSVAFEKIGRRQQCPKCGTTDGIWVGVADLGRVPDPKNPGRQKRARKAVYGQTKEEVTQKLLRLLADHQQGNLADPGRLTVAEYLQQWLTHIKPTVELRTWVGYESHVRIHLAPVIGHMQLAKLTPLDLQKLYQQRLDSGRAPRTVYHTRAVARTAFGQAVKWGLLNRNPAEATDPPVVGTSAQKFLNLDQARAFMTALDGERLGPLYLAAILTGMRLGELTGLRWQDVNLTTGAVTVSQTLWYNTATPIFKPYPKNRKLRRAVLPQHLLPALRQLQKLVRDEQVELGPAYENHGLVFCRVDGRPISSQSANNNLRRILQAAGLPQIRFHDLRHSAASILIALGEPLKNVSEILGHSTISITADLYGHLMPGAADSAAEKIGEAILGDQSAGKRRSGT